MHRASKCTRETADALLDRRGDIERWRPILKMPGRVRDNGHKAVETADGASVALIQDGRPSRVRTRENRPLSGRLPISLLIKSEFTVFPKRSALRGNRRERSRRKGF